MVKAPTNIKLNRKVVIINEFGLHARAAGRIAKLAEQASSEVYIGKDGEEVDATSIVDVIALYFPHGSELTVRITDPRDVKILDDIVRLVETGFGEM